jgi:phosphoglycolate phosphatase
VIRNVIFDWSGTVVDDLPAVWQATNHLFGRAGLPSMSLDQFRTEFELPARNFFARYVKDHSPADLQRWFLEGFLPLQSTITVLPHARQFLEFCREQGVRTFVLTAVPGPLFLAQAAAYGLTGLLGPHYCGAEDKREVIQQLLAEHGLSAAETLMVGDMPHDLDAARVAGVAGVGVLTGYCSLAQLRAGEPALVVEHLGELLGLLDRQGWRLQAPHPGKRFPLPTVGGLIFDEAGRMLLVRTRKWSDRWGIPGGKIEWGEAAEAALLRELREETGLEVRDVRFVLVQDAISPPEFYRDAHFLLLNYTCRVVGTPQVRLNDEAQEFRWLTRAEAEALPLNTPTRVLLDAVPAAGL